MTQPADTMSRHIIKRSFPPALLLTVFLICIYTPAVSQESLTVSITGRVTDQQTGNPLPNVNIFIVGTSFGSATDQDGRFEIRGVPAGEATIEFSHIGFVTRRYTRILGPGMTVTHNVAMFERPIPLEEVTVLSDSVKLKQRHPGDSYVITHDQIRESGVYSFAQLIRSFVPRAQVYEEGFDVRISFDRRVSALQRNFGDQNPLIIIDGIRIGTSPGNLIGSLHPDEIRHIEVIIGPTALIYGSEAANGVIIIETFPPAQTAGGLSAFLRILIVVGSGALLWLVL